MKQRDDMATIMIVVYDLADGGRELACDEMSVYDFHLTCYYQTQLETNWREAYASTLNRAEDDLDVVMFKTLPRKDA